MSKMLKSGFPVLILSVVSGALVYAGEYHRDKSTILKFDVVENTNRFVFSQDPVFEDELPAYGNSFVTQGYIYPKGFLDDHQGVDANGQPTHPEQIIGLWTCRGFFVGDGAHSSSGPMVITTQTYDFFEAPGYYEGKYSTKQILFSEGYELADINKRFSRAITGGTGPFSRAEGEVLQTFLGFNPYMGVRLRFLVKAAHSI